MYIFLQIIAPVISFFSISQLVETIFAFVYFSVQFSLAAFVFTALTACYSIVVLTIPALILLNFFVGFSLAPPFSKENSPLAMVSFFSFQSSTTTLCFPSFISKRIKLLKPADSVEKLFEVIYKTNANVGRLRFFTPLDIRFFFHCFCTMLLSNGVKWYLVSTCLFIILC